MQQIGIFKDGLTYSDYEITDEMGNRYSNDLREAGNIAALQDNCIGTKLNNGYIISAGFFLGFKGFYETLSDMDEEQRKLIHMNSVANVNQLYGNEQLCRAQRKDARYINIGMYLTLLGGVASD